MHKNLKTLLILSLLLVVAVIGSKGSKAERQNMVINQEPYNERTITRKADFHPPISITMVKAKDRVIETGRPFTDSDDWFNGLELKIRNDSDKTVTYVSVELTFHRPDDLPASWRLEYGVDPFRYDSAESMPRSEVNPVSPGATIPVALSARETVDLQAFLASVGFRNNGKKLEVRIIKVGFSDGNAWNAGRVYRRNPNAYKGWSPTDGSERDNVPMQPMSRKQKRTGFFLSEF